VMLDGLEISQFTYFQQCGGFDLDLIPAELTYGLERIVAFLQNVDSVYDIVWAPGFLYKDVRLKDEQQFSKYNFELADVGMLWQLFDLHEKECQRLIKLPGVVLPAYDQVLKCSHIFNLLDSRGAISVTERVGVIGRVRKLALGVANAWMAEIAPASEAVA
jgi:glycyl-tRNA synthetase alpha chain